MAIIVWLNLYGAISRIIKMNWKRWRGNSNKMAEMSSLHSMLLIYHNCVLSVVIVFHLMDSKRMLRCHCVCVQFMMVYKWWLKASMWITSISCFVHINVDLSLCICIWVIYAIFYLYKSNNQHRTHIDIFTLFFVCVCLFPFQNGTYVYILFVNSFFSDWIVIVGFVLFLNSHCFFVEWYYLNNHINLFTITQVYIIISNGNYTRRERERFKRSLNSFFFVCVCIQF